MGMHKRRTNASPKCDFQKWGCIAGEQMHPQSAIFKNGDASPENKCIPKVRFSKMGMHRRRTNASPKCDFQKRGCIGGEQMHPQMRLIEIRDALSSHISLSLTRPHPGISLSDYNRLLEYCITEPRLEKESINSSLFSTLRGLLSPIFVQMVSRSSRSSDIPKTTVRTPLS